MRWFDFLEPGEQDSVQLSLANERPVKKAHSTSPELESLKVWTGIIRLHKVVWPDLRTEHTPHPPPREGLVGHTVIQRVSFL